MKNYQTTIKIETPKRGTYNITPKIEQVLKESSFKIK
jgi:thiamine phosphate synthase YjbQ (UPF0047 family)